MSSVRGIENSPPGLRRRRVVHSHEPRFQLLLEPVGVPADIDRDRVVEHPIQDRRREHPVPPRHQQAGMPKIATNSDFVDRHTLLPQRGPQAAAALPTIDSTQH